MARSQSIHCSRTASHFHSGDERISCRFGGDRLNHIPTMRGGVGHDQLKRYYKYHFIGVNPPDFRLTLISLNDPCGGSNVVYFVFRVVSP